jgi:type VI secretion system protein ImpA
LTPPIQQKRIKKVKKTIDIDAILAPIPGDNPAGEDLRYTPIYDEIKEARRADDALEQGDWQHEIKTSDWNKVITIAVKALTQKTKDLQIAAWLTEALVSTEGFGGLATGLRILTGFLSEYWEHVYPEIEDEDLDFRIGPFEFINDKLWPSIKRVSITDTSAAPGYSWLKWQESRQVGYEADTHNQYGDVDENKKSARDESIAEGKLTGEDFDSAVALSSKAFYESLAENLALCMEAFRKLDETVDEKFGSDAPRLSEIKEAIEDCERLAAKILKEKKDREPAPEPEPQKDAEESNPVEGIGEEVESEASILAEGAPSAAAGPIPANWSPDSGSQEKAVWESALKMLKASGINKALGLLLEASCSSPSVRQRDRFRLLMAKICLKAGRPDLARPIAEKLHASIEELQLERWESPIWIAEVIDALYRCLTAGEPDDEDLARANELFQRLCTSDVTKAIGYRK